MTFTAVAVPISGLPKGAFYGIDTGDNRDSAARGRPSPLGLQPQLGIWPNRRSGTCSADPGSIDNLQRDPARLLIAMRSRVIVVY